MTIEMFSDMAKSVLDGDAEASAALARAALGEGVPAAEAIDKGFIPGIRQAGELWEAGDYFLPELIGSAEAMKAALAILRPALTQGGPALKEGTIVIGTIEGDIHDIGKNLVAAMLSANGFEVIDLGADVKLPAFIEAAEKADADIICLSALLTTTMLNQRKLLDLLVERGLRNRYKILVGGAPTSAKWAAEIAADGYGENAAAAVRAARALMGKA